MRPGNFVSLPLVPGLVTVRYQVQPLRPPLNSSLSLSLPVSLFSLTFTTSSSSSLFLSFLPSFSSLLLLFTPFATLQLRASLLNASTLTSPHFKRQRDPSSLLTSPTVAHHQQLTSNLPLPLALALFRSLVPYIHILLYISIYIFAYQPRSFFFQRGIYLLRFPLSTRFNRR